MKLKLKSKIDSSLISATSLLAAELAGLEVLIHLTYTRDAPRLACSREALLPQPYVEFATGKSYQAIKRWQERGHLKPAKMIGTAALFDAGFVEHLLATETFAASEDELCEAAWLARGFWAWIPRDRIEAAPGSPAEHIQNMPFMRDLHEFVERRLGEVAKLRHAHNAEAIKKHTRGAA